MTEEFYWVMGLALVVLPLGVVVGLVWSARLERQHERRLRDEYESPEFWGE